MSTEPASAELYLGLLKQCLTRYLFLGENGDTADPAARSEGRDWPPFAETMIGLKRLDNLQDCLGDVLQRGVPGDVIETGVWRGGAVILMRAVLRAHGIRHRIVWVADSFQGLPKPDPLYPADVGDTHWSVPQLAIPMAEVQRNFAKYGLLDSQVRFLPGLFKDTLRAAPIKQLALLRLDGDMYQSTWEALTALYSKVAIGGYVIVDDFGAVAGCRQAVEDFRNERGIREPLRPVDWTCVFWQREQ
jgi:O-methyltransferase